MSDREAAIRERAHAIWEAEGRPEGRGEQHWRQAALDIEQDQAEAAATVDLAPVQRSDDVQPESVPATAAAAAPKRARAAKLPSGADPAKPRSPRRKA